MEPLGVALLSGGPMMHVRTVVVLLVLAGLLSAVPLVNGDAKDENELEEVLAAAGRYVVIYEATFRDLVADEVYDQSVDNWHATPGLPLRRRTRADIVFVAIPGPFPWTSFRDVYEVDGKEVRDRDARVEKLFVQGQESAVKEAAAVRAESSRFNIGFQRTVNEPTLPLMFLHPNNQARFAFALRGHSEIEGLRVAEIAFREIKEPSLVFENGRPDLLSAGRVWIEPKTGTIVRTELLLKSRHTRLDAALTVSYEKAPDLDIWVPSKMRESYTGLLAVATYSNYRRFQVRTMEAIGLPPTQKGQQP
jgi:hypothetical protein